MADSGFTAEDFETWIPARDVYRSAHNAFGGIHAASTITSMLADGLIKARAAHFFVDVAERDIGLAAIIPASVWEALNKSNYLSQNSLWNTGNLEQEVYQLASSRFMKFRLYGVRFDPEGVRMMLPRTTPKGLFGGLVPSPKHPAITSEESQENAASGTTKTGGGGRPKYDYWDDLWAHIAVQLYFGDLKPTKQADIEKAMLEWADRNNHGMGDQTARARARKLWAAIKVKDRN